MISFALPIVDRTRVRYLGGNLYYSGPTGDTVFWRRDLKKWVPGPGGRLAGASVDGNWLLMHDRNGYRRLQVKWR